MVWAVIIAKEPINFVQVSGGLIVILGVFISLSMGEQVNDKYHTIKITSMPNKN
jgi:drug/metabolite transporter (DMT)-like permease